MRTIWLFPTAGLIMILFGAYVAGGWAITCARSRLAPAVSESAEGTRPELVAECRVEARRWLARKVVTERTYLHVTDVDAIAVSRTETSKDSDGRTRSYTVDDWSLRLLSGENEITRIAGTRKQVDDADQRLSAWFEKGGAEPIHAAFSQWGFALGAGGFGLLWVAVTILIVKLHDAPPLPTSWHSRRRRRPRRRPERI